MNAFLKKYGKVDFYNKANPAHQASIFWDIEKQKIYLIDFWEGYQAEYDEVIGKTALYEIYSKSGFVPIIEPLWEP